MHLIITDAWLAKGQAIHLSGTKLLLAGLAISLSLMLVAQLTTNASLPALKMTASSAATVQR